MTSSVDAVFNYNKKDVYWSKLLATKSDLSCEYIWQYLNTSENIPVSKDNSPIESLSNTSENIPVSKDNSPLDSLSNTSENIPVSKDNSPIESLSVRQANSCVRTKISFSFMRSMLI